MDTKQLEIALNNTLPFNSTVNKANDNAPDEKQHAHSEVKLNMNNKQLTDALYKVLEQRDEAIIPPANKLLNDNANTKFSADDAKKLYEIIEKHTNDIRDIINRNDEIHEYYDNEARIAENNFNIFTEDLGKLKLRIEKMTIPSEKNLASIEENFKPQGMRP